MNTTQTHTLTPAEMDTLLLDLSWNQIKASDRIHHNQQTFIKVVGREQRTGYGYPSTYFHPTEDRLLTFPEAYAIAREMLTNASDTYSDGSPRPVEYRSIRGKFGVEINEKTFRELDLYRANLTDINNQIDALNSEFVARGGWDRYWLVASSTGHIHSSQSCHTCNKGKNATEFALVPSLSNMKVEVAVQALGAGLCSVCFPDAPVEMQEQMKISKTLATVLREQGESAFVEARQKAQARADKKAGK